MKHDVEISSNLKAIRTRLGLSQHQLAETAGVARQTVGGIEAGRYAPSAAVALRLAKALGCTVEELFWLDDGLPVISAVPVGGDGWSAETRVALARVGTRWGAHGLPGEGAFRS